MASIALESGPARLLAEWGFSNGFLPNPRAWSGSSKSSSNNDLFSSNKEGFNHLKAGHSEQFFSAAYAGVPSKIKFQKVSSKNEVSKHQSP